MKKCIGVLKLFLFLTVFSCFAVYGVQQIYALEHTKTKTFQITNLGTDAKIMFHYVNDATKLDIKTETFSVTTGNSTKKVLSNGWGTVTISISGSTATISYDKVSCEYKTPYIMVKAGTKNGYMPLPGQAGWKFGTVGSTGMSDNWNPNPPREDGWANGECDLYTGVSFAYNSLEVVWAPVSTTVQYHKNDGGTSTASQTFTYGVAKQQFGKKTDGSPLWGTEKEDGFGGWDRPGYHILGWSESSTATKATYGTYSEVADSWIASKYPTVDLYAVWEPFY